MSDFLDKMRFSGPRSFLRETQERVNRFARDSSRWSFRDDDGYQKNPFDPRKKGGLDFPQGVMMIFRKSVEAN